MKRSIRVSCIIAFSKGKFWLCLQLHITCICLVCPGENCLWAEGSAQTMCIQGKTADAQMQVKLKIPLKLTWKIWCLNFIHSKIGHSFCWRGRSLGKPFFSFFLSCCIWPRPPQRPPAPGRGRGRPSWTRGAPPARRRRERAAWPSPSGPRPPGPSPSPPPTRRRRTRRTTAADGKG